MDSAGSTEEQLSSATVTNYNRESNVVTFVLNGTTEGLYFCRSGGDESQKRKLVSKWFSVKWFAGFNSSVFFSRSISTIPDSHKIRSQCNLGIAVYSWLSVQYRSTPWTVHHGVDSDRTSRSSASSSISHFKLQWLPICWIVPYNIKLHPFHWESDLYFNSQGNSLVSIITRTRSTQNFKFQPITIESG